MLSWLHRGRKIAGPKPKAPIHAVCLDAPREARRREQEANNQAEEKVWVRVAIAAAKKASGRLGVRAAVRKAPKAKAASISEGPTSPQSGFIPEQWLDELDNAISAAAWDGHNRLQGPLDGQGS
jgi:hypothetical protein